MVRTLHLADAWHGSSGGVATFYRALLKAAPASGCQMRLVVPAGTDRVEEPDPWTRIYHVRARRARLNPAYRLISPSSYLLPGGAVRRITAEEEPDLIEVCDKFTLPYLAGLLRTRRLPGVGFRPATVGLSCERLDDNVRAYLGHGTAGARFCRWYMKRTCFPMFDHIRDRESLAAHYASCDVFLHPNPSQPFGIAPLEAMASGLALVEPDSGGILSYADSTNA